MVFTLKEGKELISLARDSISKHLESKAIVVNDKTKKRYSEKQGVFVTLHKNGELRGCIGFPEPVLPLFEAVIQAAKSAAFGDPRFPSLSKEEYKDISVEISVLSIPKLIEVDKPEDYPKKIKIGKDGLIIRSAFGSGLLLPQVAPEWHWNEEEFLDNTCNKAGLSPEFWKQGNCKIFKFQAQIFKEKNGKVMEVED